MAESSSCWVCDENSVKRVINGVVDTTVNGIFYGTHISTINKDSCWVADSVGNVHMIQNGAITRTITDLGTISTTSMGGLSAVDETCFWIAISGSPAYIKRYKVGEATISIQVGTGCQSPSVSAIDANSCFAVAFEASCAYKVTTSGVSYTVTGLYYPTSVSTIDADSAWVADGLYYSGSSGVRLIQNGSIVNTTRNNVVKVDNRNSSSCWAFNASNQFGYVNVVGNYFLATFTYPPRGLSTINETDFWILDAEGYLKKYSNAALVLNIALSGPQSYVKNGVSTIFLDDNPNQSFGGGQ